MSTDAHGPAMDRWREHRATYRDDWTGRGQGVATDGVSWFVTSNDRNPGLFRYSADFATREAYVAIPRSVAGHVGAVSVHDGTVYVALESPEKVATYTRDLASLDELPIDRPVESDDKRHLAWCAVNPGNGRLYTGAWNHAARLDAYELGTGRPVPDDAITLASSVHRVQGGVFSPGGRVYLASDEKISRVEEIRRLLGPLGGGDDPEAKIFPGIHGFDAATGANLGFVRVRTRPYFPYFEEIEGVGFGPMEVGGTTRHVHLALLDKNHTWVRDDVHLISFAAPALELL